MNSHSTLSNVKRGQGPFYVSMDGVDGEAGQLDCRSVVRLLPGKRIVARGHWQGRRVFAKFYLGGRKGKRYWQRELRGLRALRDGRIPCPAILHQGTVNDGDAHVVLLEAIPDCRNLAAVWHELLEDTDRRQTLHWLMDLIALQHEQGLEHRDPHWDNFLLTGNRLYTLDGGDIAIVGGPLPVTRSLKSLGLVLAQLEPRYDALAPEAFTQYCRQRVWQPGMIWRKRLAAYVHRQRGKRRKRYLAKIFRDCTEFVCRQDHRRFTVFRREPASEGLERLLADPDASLQGRDARLLKDGNTCTVWSVPVDGRRLVIKRYNLKNRAHALNRALRPSRAAISWKNAHRLRFYGIATATPVALVEERRGALRGRAFFITEAVDGPHCMQQLQDRKDNAAEVQRAAKKIAALLKDLARLQITHGDMKGTNILWRDDQPVIVDLDALRQYGFRPLFLCKHRRDLRRFLQNWETDPALQVRMRDALHALSLPFTA